MGLMMWFSWAFLGTWDLRGWNGSAGVVYFV